MKTYLSVIIFVITTSGFSQASWGGKLYFNLTTEKGDTITSSDFYHNRLKIVSLNNANDKLKYDDEKKSFVYYSHNITEYRSFYIIFGNDTIKIEYPGLPNKCLYIKTPIKLKSGVYNYVSDDIVEIIMNNNSCVKTATNDEIFYFDRPLIKDFIDEKKLKNLKKYIKEINLEN